MKHLCWRGNKYLWNSNRGTRCTRLLSSTWASSLWASILISKWDSSLAKQGVLLCPRIYMKQGYIDPFIPLLYPKLGTEFGRGMHASHPQFPTLPIPAASSKILHVATMFSALNSRRINCGKCLFFGSHCPESHSSMENLSHLWQGLLRVNG